ncbi:MAG: hypothetical protein OEZ01_14810, partial [Candidatus Heimdallarchaeota archaeon]|nr:hypothetical protein [Candidatus Heimdallarchaeota archaeon]
MSALRFYLKLQSNNKKTYLILFFLYLAINSLFISNPSFDFTKYAFEYQEDDYIGNIPTISNETFFELNDLIYAIKEVSDKLGYFTASNYTKITLLYHNATLFTDLMVLLEFYDGNEIKLQIDPLYYRSNGNNTIYFTDFNLSNINIIESALNYTNSNIHGTILLPNDYFNSSNISIYFGINLNQELFNQGEIEQIIDKVDAEFDWWIDNIEEIWEIDIIYENLISTTIIQLQENQSLLTFNSFFLVIIFIGGLTIFLFYCQLLIYNRDLASYYTGYLRGFNPKMIYRLFPLYFILSQAIIGIMSILTSKLILQGSFEFNLNQFLPVLIGIITAVYAVISSLDKFKRFEPQDATDITINTNVMEQFFLLMTILVALVNITLNSDLIKYEDLILVMFIYLFFGLIFSYILAKIVLISGKKINDFIKNQNITISSTNLYYYVNNIVINHKSRKFKLSMLIGFVVISLTIHGYISYNIMKNPNYDNYAGDFSGSYSNFSEISTLQHNPNEFTMSLQIPANLISFGIQLEGFITTDTNLMQLEENIINIDDDVEFPSLWLRSDSMELFDDLNFRDNNLINIVLFGSQELEIPH